MASQEDVRARRSRWSLLIQGPRYLVGLRLEDGRAKRSCWSLPGLDLNYAMSLDFGYVLSFVLAE
eukprot:8705427-Pyramimonas_sp.AAC.1